MKWTGRNFRQDQLAIKDKFTKEGIHAVHTKRAIQKWFHRTQATKRIRNNIKLMKQNKLFRLRIMAWEGLSFRRGAAKDMTQSLSNFERFLLTKMKQDAFGIICSYSKSKGTASAINKNRAVLDMASKLAYNHDTKLRGYFIKYKLVVLEKRMRATHVKKIMLKI